MKGKKCLICGMNINLKNMLFNRYAYEKINEEGNIFYCPFCGAGEKYLTDKEDILEIDDKSLDDKTLNILDKAMKLETFNGEFYEDAYVLAKDENIKRLFKDLSKVEFMHARIHKNLGGIKNLPKLQKPDYRRYDTDLLLLKEADNREKHAISFYNRNFDFISNPSVKEIINELANVEREHISIAKKLYNKVV